MLDWLEETQRRLESGIEDAGDLSLSPADVELLLELARTAAHESGERTNAPLVSYLVGLATAVARTPRWVRPSPSHSAETRPGKQFGS